MNKINYTNIVKQLNENCKNKDRIWERYDIDFEDGHNKYCSLYPDVLCENCSKILNNYQILYNLIIGTSIESFNKLTEKKFIHNFDVDLEDS